MYNMAQRNSTQAYPIVSTSREAQMVCRIVGSDALGGRVSLGRNQAKYLPIYLAYHDVGVVTGVAEMSLLAFYGHNKREAKTSLFY